MTESSNPPSLRQDNLHEKPQRQASESIQLSNSYPSLNNEIQLKTILPAEARNTHSFSEDYLSPVTIGVPIVYPGNSQAQFKENNSLTLEKSSFFQKRDCKNKAVVISSIVFNIGFGIATAQFLLNTCKSRGDGILMENLQQMIYFFTKALYHILISFQFCSKQLSNEVAFKMGQFKTSDENAAYFRYYYQIMTDKMRQAELNLLDKQYMSFYYQRTTFLKFLFLLKGFCTLTFMIYLYIQLIFGTFYCSLELTLFSYISIISVSLVNVFAFGNLFAFIKRVLLYISKIIYIKIRNLSLNQGFIEQFRTVSYVNGIVEGDNSCLICQMDYIFGDTIIILPCNQLHHFHKTCIKAELQINPLCPKCKIYISTDYQQMNSSQQLQHRV